MVDSIPDGLQYAKASRKAHRKTPERAPRLKAFRMRCEVSGNLTIRAYSRITSLSKKPAADWFSCVGQCSKIQST